MSMGMDDAMAGKIIAPAVQQHAPTEEACP